MLAAVTGKVDKSYDNHTSCMENLFGNLYAMFPLAPMLQFTCRWLLWNTSHSIFYCLIALVQFQALLCRASLRLVTNCFQNVILSAISQYIQIERLSLSLSQHILKGLYIQCIHTYLYNIGCMFYSVKWTVSLRRWKERGWHGRVVAVMGNYISSSIRCNISCILCIRIALRYYFDAVACTSQRYCEPSQFSVSYMGPIHVHAQLSWNNEMCLFAWKIQSLEINP